VETIAKIRRAYFVQGKALKAISRELKNSRKVVRKVIRSGATEFAYERTVQPQPGPRSVGIWISTTDDGRIHETPDQAYFNQTLLAAA